MNENVRKSSVLILGAGRLSYSVPVCLLQAGHTVTFITEDPCIALKAIEDHLSSVSGLNEKICLQRQLQVRSALNNHEQYSIGIAVTGEDIEEKRIAILQLEKHLLPESILAINTESIPLEDLQEACYYPDRIFGLNWTEPAHTTYFLEIITNEKNNQLLTNGLFNLSKDCWSKDPYLVTHGASIRSKMLGAMAREAFFLVQNGYASIEDIDRACRNDPGYYLPFAGNFRYMDLMGTYAYGLVMKDLNRELSQDQSLPEFFEHIILQGGQGMENYKGFYDYEHGDVVQWREQFGKFSYQIQEIMRKYPFRYQEKLSDH
jgi:3-hydroxybutyryl-CoA dehydrogenase